jgi:O-antigen/teichoic acid export membrane protein
MLGTIRLPFRWASMGESLRYALPLVPATVLEGLASVLDRVVLDKFVPLAQIGLYNLGNQFASALNVFNQILKAAWIPFVFRATSERADGPAVLGKFSVYYVAALCVPALGVALLSKEFIVLLGDTRYHGVYDFVPVFVLVCLVQGAGTALGRGIDIAKKTSWGIVVPAVSVVTGLVALWFMVPAFGVWGAVGATLIAAVVRIGTHIGLALYFYPRPLHVKALGAICVITLTAFFLGYAVETGSLLLDASLKLLLIAVAAGTIFWFALDRQQGLSLLRKWAGSN